MAQRRRREARAAELRADLAARATAHRKQQRRSRLTWIVAMWVLAVGPALALGWAFMGWWVLILAAGIVWLTWDYYRSGGMVDALEASQRAGVYVPEAFDDTPRRERR